MGSESKESHQQSVKGWDYCLDVSSGKYIQNNLYFMFSEYQPQKCFG